MKRILAVLAAVLTALSLSADSTVQQETTAVILGFDLDGAAANDAAIFADTNIADGASYTITGQPDTCRALVATVTDADSSIAAGTVTVVGTDGNGLSQTTTFVLNGGSGTRAITGTWCSVTSVSNGTVTGETAGTDKLRMGTTSTLAFQYPIAQGLISTPGLGDAGAGVPVVNPSDLYQPGAIFRWKKLEPGKKIKTTGTSATTAATSFTASGGAFASIAQWDIISVVDASGVARLATVVARADSDNVTLDRPLLLNASGGHTFYYRQRKVFNGILRGWVNVSGWSKNTFFIDVQQMTGTGGIDVVLECSYGYPMASFATVASSNIASAGTKVLSVPAIDSYDACRVGTKWATNDDADASAGAEERINIYIIQQR